MRVSRQTELVQKYPIHLVCYWLGNSALVAKKHYLQIRNEDFAAADTIRNLVKQRQRLSILSKCSSTSDRIRTSHELAGIHGGLPGKRSAQWIDFRQKPPEIRIHEVTGLGKPAVSSLETLGLSR